MKHKKLFISLTAVLSVIVCLFVFVMVWYFGDSYKDFKNFRQEFAIPGLDDGAVPQGMGNCSATYDTTDDEGKTVSATQQYFFISAYMVDGSPSRLYVTGANTGYVGYVTMKNTDGTDFTGHCGGVATNGTYLWVTGEGEMLVAKASSSNYLNIAQEIISKAATGGSIKFTASFNANCNTSFCFYYDDPSTSSVTSDRLYVGEFYRKGNYETDMKHRQTTPCGYANTAFVYEYNVNNSGNYGLTCINSTYTDAVAENFNVPEIKKIISIPEKIQGFARVNDMIVLSQSYGASNSHILCYDWTGITGNTDSREKYSTLTGENFVYDGIFKKSGAPFTVSSLYVYYVDNNNADQFINDYSIPAMSEGLCTVGNRVYVLSESASQKYNKVVRERVKYVYSVIPHKG